jgi:hypothetical protein
MKTSLIACVVALGIFAGLAPKAQAQWGIPGLNQPVISLPLLTRESVDGRSLIPKGVIYLDEVDENGALVAHRIEIGEERLADPKGLPVPIVDEDFLEKGHKLVLRPQTSLSASHEARYWCASQKRPQKPAHVDKLGLTSWSVDYEPYKGVAFGLQRELKYLDGSDRDRLFGLIPLAKRSRELLASSTTLITPRRAPKVRTWEGIIRWWGREIATRDQGELRTQAEDKHYPVPGIRLLTPTDPSEVQLPVELSGSIPGLVLGYDHDEDLLVLEATVGLFISFKNSDINGKGRIHLDPDKDLYRVRLGVQKARTVFITGAEGKFLGSIVITPATASARPRVEVLQAGIEPEKKPKKGKEDKSGKPTPRNGDIV